MARFGSNGDPGRRALGRRGARRALHDLARIPRAGGPVYAGPMVTTRRADMFLDLADDPRETGPALGDEMSTLVEALRCQRLTLEIKCSDLDAEQMARRSVEPSTLSLLGLVRHLAEMERAGFRRLMAGQDVPKLYTSPDNRDGDFDDAVADPTMVEEAWAAWRDAVDFAVCCVGGGRSMGRAQPGA